MSVLFRYAVALIAIHCFVVLPTEGQPPASPAKVRVQADIVYTTASDRELALDLASPDDDSELRPCILVIHGGGWRQGNRQSQMKEVQWLARRGYVAATVTYRLAPDHQFPAALNDVQAAVGFLRDHAQDYGIDPDRIGAMGYSAGAHLAMLLGTVDEPTGDQTTAPPKVSAVVAHYGPADLTQPLPGAGPQLTQQFLGGTAEQVPAMYTLASPVHHVDAADAPMLLLQGTGDELVRWSQAVTMAEKLTAAGVPGRVELIVGAGHGWRGEDQERLRETSLAFFNEYLSPPTP